MPWALHVCYTQYVWVSQKSSVIELTQEWVQFKKEEN
jgi:hypothetical protein